MFKIITPVGFDEMLIGERVADQTAALLNKNNNLYKKHDRYTINNPTDLYIVYISNGNVAGVTCIREEYYQLTRNKHTSVDPTFRRMGIGKKLVTEAMNNCYTKNMYVTIRETNRVSINLYTSLGFTYVKEYDNKGNKIIVFGRRIR